MIIQGEIGLINKLLRYGALFFLAGLGLPTMIFVGYVMLFPEQVAVNDPYWLKVTMGVLFIPAATWSVWDQWKYTRLIIVWFTFDGDWLAYRSMFSPKIKTVHASEIVSLDDQKMMRIKRTDKIIRFKCGQSAILAEHDYLGSAQHELVMSLSGDN